MTELMHARDLHEEKTRKLDESDAIVMEKQTRVDRLSNLPWDVLDRIFVKLSLRDVVRTSILSHQWRYKWTGISQLVIDDKCFLRSKKEPWGDIKKIVNQIQSNQVQSDDRRGPIEKFKLAGYCTPKSSDLEDWISFFAENGIKELIVEEVRAFRRFKIPSSLLSCSQLSCLELFFCIFKLPSTFAGFNCLKKLQLTEVSFTSDALESLVCNCPSLERLKLLDVQHLVSVRIHNPQLKYLRIDSEFKDICLENNMSLTNVDICLISLYEMIKLQVLKRGKPCNLVRVFGSLFNVKKLTLSGNFLEFLAIDMPERHHFVLNHLLYLEIKNVKFNSSLTSVKVLYNILGSCPNLEELVINIEPCGSGSFYESCQIIDFVLSMRCLCFDKLKVVRFKGCSGTHAEWNFIYNLLANSPLLEKLITVSYLDGRFPESIWSDVHRASKGVKIMSLAL